MNKNKDYQNYDYIELIVKKEHLEEVINAYGALLWIEQERHQNKKYSDVIHICFKRQHKIPLKDRLQLLQVYYEFALNQKEQLQIDKHSKSKATIFSTIFLSAILLFGCGVLIFLFTALFVRVVASLMIALIGIADVFLSFIIRKTYRRENEEFLTKRQEIEIQKQNILKEISKLTKHNYMGEKNEK